MAGPKFRIRGAMVATAVVAAYLAAFHAGVEVGKCVLCWSIPPLVLAPFFIRQGRSSEDGSAWPSLFWFLMISMIWSIVYFTAVAFMITVRTIHV